MTELIKQEVCLQSLIIYRMLIVFTHGNHVAVADNTRPKTRKRLPKIEHRVIDL